MQRSFITLTALLIVCSMLSLSACSSRRRYVGYEIEVQTSGVVDIPDADLIEETYAAVDEMLKRSRIKLTSNQKIVTATFVDLADLSQTRDFGRLLGEFAAARLTQKGLAAMNMNLRDGSVAIQQREGQFALSRDMQVLSERYDAEVALVGTFTEAVNVVFVTMRLVMTNDNTIAGSVDFELPRGPRTRALLGYAPATVVQPSVETTTTYQSSWSRSN